MDTNKKIKNRPPIIVSLFFLFLGIIWLVFLGFHDEIFILNKTDFKDIESTIIDYEKHEDSDGDESYYPIVEYYVDGQRYTTQSHIGSGKPSIGEKIIIKYDPNNPSNALVPIGSSGEIFGKIVGTIITVIGISLLISSLKRKDDNSESSKIEQNNNQISNVTPTIESPNTIGLNNDPKIAQLKTTSKSSSKIIGVAVIIAVTIFIMFFGFLIYGFIKQESGNPLSADILKDGATILFALFALAVVGIFIAGFIIMIKMIINGFKS